MRIMRLLTNSLTIFSLVIFTNLSYGQETIPIEILESGHIIIKAKVNGVDGKFFFDTGGGITLLTKQFSEKVKGLNKQDGVFTGFRSTGERLDLDLYKAEKISIGKWHIDKPVISVIDADLAGFDGLISLNLFGKQPFTLDLKNKTFTFETPEGLAKRELNGRNIKLQVRKDRDKSIDIFTYVVLNGQDTLQFSLDSGAGYNSFKINSRYLRNRDDTAKVKRFLKKSEFDANYKTEYFITDTRKLALKDFPAINVENFKTKYSDLIYDGIASVNWLGNVLTIDLDKERLIIGN
jgi:hypothetical protein